LIINKKKDNRNIFLLYHINRKLLKIPSKNILDILDILDILKFLDILNILNIFISLIYLYIA
jgi:hypothetical protein